MQLASRFASRSAVLRLERPLSDEKIRAVAPSIFADAPHESRSQRYSYAPTCCGRLCESVPSPTLAVRCLCVNEGRFTDTPTRPQLWSFHASPQICCRKLR